MSVPRHDTLDGQVALVTGANRGIGAAIVAGLVDHGATVYAGARDPTDVTNDGVHPVELDVTDEDSMESALGTVLDGSGRLDVLVNNAAVPGPDGPIGESPTPEIDRVLDTNLRGPALLCKHALPHLLEREGGRVVNVSSTAGQLHGGMDRVRGVYGISKTGVNGLTGHLHGAYADEGLIASSASPGWVRTRLGGDRAPQSPEEGADTPVWCCGFAPGAPGGRFWHDREAIEW